MNPDEFRLRADSGEIPTIDPKLQTAARSGNKYAIREMERQMAAQQRDIAAQQERAAREQQQAAEAAMKEQAREQERQRARDVRAWAAAGAKIETDIETNKKSVKLHQDGTPVSESGPIGDPRVVTIEPQGPMPGTGAPQQPVTRVNQTYRDDRWNEVTESIPPKTDPKTGEQYVETKDSFGRDVRTVTGVDPDAQKKLALETESAQLDLAKNNLAAQKLQNEESWRQIDSTYQAAKAQLDKPGKFRQGPKGWEDEQGFPADPAALAQFQKERAQIVAQYQAAARQYGQMQPARKNLEEQERKIALRKIEIDSERTRLEHGLPSATSTTAQSATAEATGELTPEQQEVVAAIATVPGFGAALTLDAQPDAPDAPPAAPLFPTDDDGKRALVASAFQGFVGADQFTIGQSGDGFTFLQRNGENFASLEADNETGQPVVVLNDNLNQNADLRQIVAFGGTGGTPIYLRQGTGTRSQRKENAFVTSVFQAFKDDPTLADDPDRARVTLAAMGADPATIQRRVLAGDLSVQRGEELMQGIYGSTLKADDPLQPATFDRWMTESAPEETRRAWAVAKGQRDTAGQNDIKRQFLNEWFVTNRSRPGVTLETRRLAEKALLGEARAGEKAEAFAGEIAQGAGSMLGLLGAPLMLAQLRTLSLLGDPDAATAEAEVYQNYGRGSKNVWRGFEGNRERFLTAEGKARMSRLAEARSGLRTAITTQDVYPDGISNPEWKANYKAAIDNHVDAMLAVHDLNQEAGWNVTRDDIDPAKNPQLAALVNGAAITGDMTMLDAYFDAVFQDHGTRQAQAYQAELTAGASPFMAGIIGGATAPPEEIGMEMISAIATGILGKAIFGGAKAAKLADAAGDAAGAAVRVNRFRRAALGVLDEYKQLGMVEDSLANPATKAGKIGNAITKGAKVAIPSALSEGPLEEGTMALGDPNLTPETWAKDSLMGAVLGVIAAPVLAGPAVLAQNSREAYQRAQIAGNYAAKYNRAMAGTPGFRALSAKDAETVISLMDPARKEQAIQNARTAAGNLIQAVEAASVENPAPEAVEALSRAQEASLKAQNDLALLVADQTEAVASLQSVPAEKRDFARAVLKVASGHPELLTPQERTAAAGAMTESKEPYFANVNGVDVITDAGRVDALRSMNRIGKLIRTTDSQILAEQQFAAQPGDPSTEVSPEATTAGVEGTNVVRLPVRPETDKRSKAIARRVIQAVRAKAPRIAERIKVIPAYGSNVSGGVQALGDSIFIVPEDIAQLIEQTPDVTDDQIVAKLEDDITVHEITHVAQIQQAAAEGKAKGYAGSDSDIAARVFAERHAQMTPAMLEIGKELYARNQVAGEDFRNWTTLEPWMQAAEIERMFVEAVLEGRTTDANRFLATATKAMRDYLIRLAERIVEAIRSGVATFTTADGRTVELQVSDELKARAEQIAETVRQLKANAPADQNAPPTDTGNRPSQPPPGQTGDGTGQPPEADSDSATPGDGGTEPPPGDDTGASDESDRIEAAKELLSLVATVGGKSWGLGPNDGPFDDERPFVFIKVGKGVLPFYRSSKGTSGKQKGGWSPFFGVGSHKGGDWIIKGTTEDIADGYGDYEIARIQQLLNTTTEGKSALWAEEFLRANLGDDRGKIGIRQASQLLFGKPRFENVTPHIGFKEHRTEIFNRLFDYYKAPAQALTEQRKAALQVAREAFRKAFAARPILKKAPDVVQSLEEVAYDLAEQIEGLSPARQFQTATTAINSFLESDEIAARIAEIEAAEEARVQEYRRRARARIEQAADEAISRLEIIGAMDRNGIRINLPPSILNLIKKRRDDDARLTQNEIETLEKFKGGEWDSLPRKADYAGDERRAILQAIVGRITAPYGSGQNPDQAAQALEDKNALNRPIDVDEMLQKIRAELDSVSRSNNTALDRLDDPNAELTDEEIEVALERARERDIHDKWRDLTGFHTLLSKGDALRMEAEYDRIVADEFGGYEPEPEDADAIIQRIVDAYKGRTKKPNAPNQAPSTPAQNAPMNPRVAELSQPMNDGLVIQDAVLDPAPLTAAQNHLPALTRITNTPLVKRALSLAERIIPYFQGNKLKMTGPVTSAVEQYTTPEQRAAVTTVYDLFGGGGAWGLVLAESLYPNVRKIHINEYDSGRAIKIKAQIEYGNEFAALADTPEVRHAIGSIIAAHRTRPAVQRKIERQLAKQAQGDFIGQENLTPEEIAEMNEAWSWGVINKTAAEFAKRLDPQRQDRVIAVLKTMADDPERSGPWYKADPDAEPTVDEIVQWFKTRHAPKAAAIHETAARMADRGVKITVAQGDAYALQIDQGPTVAVVADPPYFATTGYDEVNQKQVVGTDYYRQSATLMNDLVANDNHIIYTDEAWWLRDKIDPAIRPADLVTGQKLAEEIGNTLDFMVVADQIDSRYETLGLHNPAGSPVAASRSSRRLGDIRGNNEGPGDGGGNRSGGRPAPVEVPPGTDGQAGLQSPDGGAADVDPDLADELRRMGLGSPAGPNGRPAVQTTDGRTLEAPGMVLMSPAYHGTPHKVDRFRLDKIGTGEGAQAYGWGLYFAQSEKVGAEYRDKLSQGYKLEDSDGKPFEPSTNPQWKASDLLIVFKGDYDKTLRSIEVSRSEDLNLGTFLQKMDYDQVVKTLEYMRERGVKVVQKGNLYKVDLKPAEDEYLDWDKPLIEQSVKVREAFADLYDMAMSEMEYQDSKQVDKYSNGKITGGALYRRMTLRGMPFSSEKSASQFLHKKGVKGIRYLDGNSRADGQGTYNYVIFDEADIEITEENGNPVQASALFSPAVAPRKRNEDWTQEEIAALKKQYDDLAEAIEEDRRKRQEEANRPPRDITAEFKKAFAPIDQNNPFRDWNTSTTEPGILIGYRGENGNGQADNGFGSSEGVGLYIAKERETSSWFGKVREVKFPKPKRPIIVDENGTDEVIPMLKHEGNELAWPRIYSHKTKNSDSDWMKAHILAAKQIGLTEETYHEKIGGFPRALTDKLLAMGYDAVYVRTAGMEWVNLLAKPGQRFNRGTRTERGTALYSPASSNPAAEYRYLKAKQEKSGLTPAENEALLRAEKAMGQSFAIDMDDPALRARKGSVSPAFQPSLNLETVHPITGQQLALFSPAPSNRGTAIRKALLAYDKPANQYPHEDTDQYPTVIQPLLDWGNATPVSSPVHLSLAADLREAYGVTATFARGYPQKSGAFVSPSFPSHIVVNVDHPTIPMGWVIAHEIVHVAQKDSRTNSRAFDQIIRSILPREDIEKVEAFVRDQGYVDDHPDNLRAEVMAFLVADSLGQNVAISLSQNPAVDQAKALMRMFFDALPVLRPDAKPGELFSDPTTGSSALSSPAASPRLTDAQYARHAELEAKNDAGTLTDAERREAAELVDAGVRKQVDAALPLWRRLAALLPKVDPYNTTETSYPRLNTDPELFFNEAAHPQAFELGRAAKMTDEEKLVFSKAAVVIRKVRNSPDYTKALRQLGDEKSNIFKLASAYQRMPLEELTEDDIDDLEVRAELATFQGDRMEVASAATAEAAAIISVLETLGQATFTRSWDWPDTDPFTGVPLRERFDAGSDSILRSPAPSPSARFVATLNSQYNKPAASYSYEPHQHPDPEVQQWLESHKLQARLATDLLQLQDHANQTYGISIVFASGLGGEEGARIPRDLPHIIIVNAEERRQSLPAILLHEIAHAIQMDPRLARGKIDAEVRHLIPEAVKQVKNDIRQFYPDNTEEEIEAEAQAYLLADSLIETPLWPMEDAPRIQEARKLMRDYFEAIPMLQPAANMDLYLFSPAPAPFQKAVDDTLKTLAPIYREVFKASQASPTPTPQELADRFGVSARAIENILGTVRARLRSVSEAAAGDLKPNPADAGRPDLGYSTVPALQRVDQLRNQEGLPNGATLDEIRKAGEAYLRQPNAIQRLIEADGEWNATETAAANIALAESALRSEVTEQTALLANLYREQGSRWSEAGRARRDVEMSPAERSAMLIHGLLVDPDARTTKALKRAKTADEKRAILAAWTARVTGIKQSLKDRGIDVDAAMARLNEQVADAKAAESEASERHQMLVKALQDRVAELEIAANQANARAKSAAGAAQQAQAEAEAARAAAALQKAQEATKQAEALDPANTIKLELRKLSKPRRIVVETMRNRGTWQQAAEQTGMSVEECRKVMLDFIGALKKAAVDAILLAEDMMLGNQALNAPSPLNAAAPEGRNARAAKIADAMVSAAGYDMAAFDRRSSGKPATTGKKGTAATKAKADRPEPAMMSDEEFARRQNSPDVHRALWQWEMTVTQPQSRISFGDWMAKPQTKARMQRQQRMFAQPVSTFTGTLDMHDPHSVRAAAREVAGTRASLFDKVVDYWRMAILTGPQTAIVNTASNVMHSLYHLGPRRLVEAGINDVLGLFGAGDKNSATLGEVAAMTRVIHRALTMAGQNMVKSWNDENRIAESMFTQTYQQHELGQMKGEDLTPALQGPLGTLMRSLSYRHMTAADEFIKALHGTMEAAAQAHRIAKREKLTGKAYAARIDELLGEFGSETWIKALEVTKDITFQRKLNPKDPRALAVLDKLGAAIKRGTGKYRALSFFFPFVNTPTNIFKSAIEMSPIGALLAIIDGARALKIRYASGNMDKRAAAVAASELYDRTRLVKDLTNQIIAAGVFWALSGMVEPDEDDESGLPRITGTVDWKATRKGERDNQYRTMPPMSIRLGDTIVSYSRVEPFATMLAGVVDLIHELNVSGGVNDKLVGAYFGRIQNQLTDKTFLAGVSDLVKAAQDPERFTTKLADGIVTGFVPNLIRQPIREVDPVLRDVSPREEDGFFTALGKQLGYSLAPGYAPPQVDVWGNPVARHHGQQLGTPQTDILIRVFDPSNIAINKQIDPIDLYIFNWNSKTDLKRHLALEPIRDSLVATRGGKTIKLPLTPQEQAEANRRAGKAAREFLGNEWDWKNPTEQGIERIKEVVRRFQNVERDRLRLQKLRAMQ